MPKHRDSVSTSETSIFYFVQLFTAQASEKSEKNMQTKWPKSFVGLHAPEVMMD